jgi:hypothetical protein
VHQRECVMDTYTSWFHIDLYVIIYSVDNGISICNIFYYCYQRKLTREMRFFHIFPVVRMGHETRVVSRNAKTQLEILKISKYFISKSFEICFFVLYAIDYINVQCVKVCLKSSVYFWLFLGLKFEFSNSSIYIFPKIAQIGSFQTANTIYWKSFTPIKKLHCESITSVFFAIKIWGKSSV